MRPVLELSATQLRRNVSAVRARLSPSALLLTMKDDAYGHGVEWVLGALGDAASVTRFGGYDVATGERIRALRPHAQIFAWATSDDGEIARGLEARLELGVGSAEYLRRVIAAAQRTGRQALVHLKIDTGLHRSGVRPEDWSAVVGAAVAAQREGLVRVVGIWSHLAEASDAEDDEASSAFQRALVVARRAGIDPDDTHLTASAASWWRPELRGTVSRVGAFCYGIRSADGPLPQGIRPVATLRATVCAVGRESVEIGIGALHGLPSTLSGSSVGTPSGPRAIVRLGDTSTTVDGWAGARVGDEVAVFGPGERGEPDATALGEAIGTVGEEILTRLTPAVRRVGTR